MRPALEGFAGIPQEVRLLFRGLRKLPGTEVEGLLQTSHRFLSPGVKEGGRYPRASRSRTLDRYSKVIVSMAAQPHEGVFDRLKVYLRRRMSVIWLTALIGFGLGKIRLGRFDAKEFSDFTWRALFSKSL